jgi:hypothetical protein
MGHVWLARDERSGLDVALKIVARDGKAASRAEREAVAAAALRHPRCQRIYALARDRGHVYISYEYVPGRTLRDVMRAGGLDDRSAVEAAAQICEALAHAHGRGIVHRDVKPSNVLLAETDGIDVRLLDFGLAKMAEFDTLTEQGDVPGTLAYISPERLLGESASFAADIWSVGVILWEALAGQHPFWEGGVTETSRRIQEGAPPLEELRPDLPRPLRDLVASTLAANPARRPEADRLAHELRTLPRRRGRRRSTSGSATPLRGRALAAVPQRLVPAALAAATTGWVAATIPFYPESWPTGIAATAGAVAFASPRAGLAFALTVAFFPLANISLGLAIVYGAAALLLLALGWRDPRAGLVFATGPLLAALGGLVLVPLATQFARGSVRRALQAATAVVVAAIVAGFRGVSLPFDGSAPPAGLGIDGSDRPSAVGHALWETLSAHPVLVLEAGIAAVAAVALSFVRRRGPWPAVLFAGGLLAAAALAAPAAPFAALAAGAWVTASALALERADHPRTDELH